jgi:SAM-dependent methyltransferase
LYVSGTSKTLRESFKQFAWRTLANVKYQDSRPRVLDIACNDGSLLNEFKNLGCEVVGVDPAKNLRHFTEELGIHVHVGMWDEAAVEAVGQFDIITAFNVLAHTADPQGFLNDCFNSMKSGARLWIQTSQVEWLDNQEFDCVYHEHVSYFSKESMERLAKRCGFVVESMKTVPDHGVSLLTCLRSPYRDMQLRTQEFRRNALDTIFELSNSVWTICGYGAAAKAMVVLQSTDVHLEFIVDENPLKIGRLAPGTLIPVVDQSRLIDPPKLAVVILAWNFADEIKAKVRSLREGKKTCFVILPDKVSS